MLYLSYVSLRVKYRLHDLKCQHCFTKKSE